MICKWCNCGGAKRPLFLFLIPLILASLACQTGQQPGSESTEAENGQSAIATTIADISPFGEDKEASENIIGITRANPFPPETIIKEGQWTIELLETERGEPAWQAVHLANPNNQLPPDGWEYLNAKLRIKNNELTTDESSLSISVTGDGRVKYPAYESSVVSPEPQLDTYLPGRTESEGWETFIVRKNEDNLMFVFSYYGDYDDPPLYLAIEDDAAVTVDEATMMSMTRTELGTTQDQPVPFGQTATGEDWQLIVLDVKTGDDAWNLVLEENQFNDPPEEGMEYIMVKLRARYIGLKEEGENIDDYSFFVRTNSGNEFDAPSVVEPEPNLDHHIYPGGEAEGWIVLTVPEKTKNLTLYFSPDSSGANDRYLSLGQGR